MSTIAELLRSARGAGLDRLDGELIAAHVLGVDRAAIIARPERETTALESATIARLVGRRAAGEPFAHLVGHRDFHGIRVQVTADVLVPRPDTEILVDAVLARLDDAPRRVADLGTGSGCIALALAAERPAWTLLATDTSTAALAVARANAAALDLDERVGFRTGDWFRALDGEAPLDAIVSNPPYVETDDPDLAEDVAKHEPPAALFAGADGLEALREIASGAPRRLRPGGLLALEHGARQGAAVRSLLRAAGFVDVETLADLGGNARATLGRLDGGPGAAARGRPEDRSTKAREPETPR